MEPVLERGDDAEIAAAAAQAPEQFRVLLGARRHQFAVGGDDVGRDEVVAAEPVLAHQPAEPAAQGQPGDAGGRDHPAGAGETESLGLAVVLAPGQAGLGARPCARPDRPARPSSATNRASARARKRRCR